jgi:hypothetical protein
LERYDRRGLGEIGELRYFQACKGSCHILSGDECIHFDKVIELLENFCQNKHCCGSRLKLDLLIHSKTCSIRISERITAKKVKEIN